MKKANVHGIINATNILDIQNLWFEHFYLRKPIKEINKIPL